MPKLRSQFHVLYGASENGSSYIDCGFDAEKRSAKYPIEARYNTERVALAGVSSAEQLTQKTN